MPKYRVVLSTPCSTGSHRHEVGDFFTNCVRASFLDKELSSLIDFIPVVARQQVPCPVARNQLVKIAQSNKADFLLMVDDDAFPSGTFFKRALQFLVSQPVPSVIASPYCSVDGETQIFEFTTKQPKKIPLDSWALSRIPREDSRVRTGIQQIAAIGSHLIMYDMRAFEKIKKPYYQYSYDPDHETVTETEEMFLCRNLFHARVPVFVDWESWSGHWKLTMVGMPPAINPDDIPEFYFQEALSHLLYTKEGKKLLEDTRKRQKANPKSKKENKR